MKSPQKLRIVSEQPIDINALNRADVKAHDWARVMIEGDRRAPLPFLFVRRRGWRL